MRCLLAVSVVWLVFAGTASGKSIRQLQDGHVGTSRAELVAQRHQSLSVIRFFKRTPHRWLVAPHHATCWSIHGRDYRRKCDRARRALLANRWLLKVAERRYAALYAPRLPWAFWDCVASGRLGGVRVSSGEGGATSYNPAGPFIGRYQMDPAFEQHYGQDMLTKYGGRDARSWSVVDQTVVAERGFQVQGPQAWPNTAPPCMSLR